MQDFSKKISIAVNRKNERWQSMNAVAHTSAYLGNKMKEPFDTGEFFVTKDNVSYPRNSQYAIIVLEASDEQIKDFLNSICANNLSYMAFFRDMIETTDDTEIIELLSNKQNDELDFLGVGVFGDKDKLKLLTKGFSLFK